jgi:hypothetical protein
MVLASVEGLGPASGRSRGRQAQLGGSVAPEQRVRQMKLRQRHVLHGREQTSTVWAIEARSEAPSMARQNSSARAFHLAAIAHYGPGDVAAWCLVSEPCAPAASSHNSMRRAVNV